MGTGLESILGNTEGVSIDWIDDEYEKKYGESLPAGWGSRLAEQGVLQVDQAGVAEFEDMQQSVLTKPFHHIPSSLISKHCSPTLSPDLLKSRWSEDSKEMVSVSCLPPTQYPGGDRWGVTVVTVLCADAGYTVCVQLQQGHSNARAVCKMNKELNSWARARISTATADPVKLEKGCHAYFDLRQYPSL